MSKNTERPPLSESGWYYPSAGLWIYASTLRGIAMIIMVVVHIEVFQYLIYLIQSVLA